MGKGLERLKVGSWKALLSRHVLDGENPKVRAADSNESDRAGGATQVA